MNAILAILTTLVAVASAGIHGYGDYGHGHHHAIAVPVAPVVHVAPIKVPFSTWIKIISQTTRSLRKNYSYFRCLLQLHINTNIELTIQSFL